MLNRSLLFLACLFLIFVAGAYAAPPQPAAAKIHWVDWTDDAFAQAAKEKRLVLLDLEAVWCHWCHVMDEKTYADARIVDLISKHFIAIRVDQAARPDLAARYQDYGWPATVVLNAKGQDLWKEAGFIEPDEFSATLKKLVANPQIQKDDALPKNAAPAPDGLLTVDLRAKLQSRFLDALDMEQGGLKGTHRYLRSDAIEYALLPGELASSQTREWAAKTLTASLKLLDPAWGGMYQYSTKSGWDSPHFEKIMSTQAKGIEGFVAGAAVIGNASYLDAARSIRRYVKNFLTSPEGAFYASQDADYVKGMSSVEYFRLDAEARPFHGIPEVQKQVYARENGWMINALTTLYATTAEPELLSDAVKAAQYIQAQRALPGGGFKHAETDAAGPYLGDNLAMLEAFLGLYRVSADRVWLQSAAQVGQFIIATFVDGTLDSKSVGVMSAKRTSSPLFTPVYTAEENIDLARAANTLFQYTGKQEFRSLAEAALRYAGQSQVALEYATEPSLSVADLELRSEPLHITVVANKDDEKGRELFLAGNRYYAPYKRLEWWDKREGPLPRDDVKYPQLAKAAGFICTNKRCSLPIFDGQKLGQTIDLFKSKEKPA